MPKIADPLNNLNPQKRKELEELEIKADEILDMLWDDPGNSALASRLSEIEIKIVTITGEKTIDY